MLYPHSVMDIRDLTYLHAIIDTGSVVAAAEKIGRTPPALTKAMRRLEAEIGCPLFDKIGRGIGSRDTSGHSNPWRC
jgi:DNA-binding transcriptional LysR family regulator